MSALGDAIKDARERKKLSQMQLGEHFGITKSAVSAWESGKSVPDQRKLGRLVQLLDLDPKIAAGVPEGPSLIVPPQTAVVAVAQPTGPADIPVWASIAAGDDEGSMILTDTPIDWIRRSDRMMGVANPFAFYVVGDSMLERFAPGDQAVVNPSMPLRAGADCVFIHQGPEGALYGLVKRLLRANADVWRVRQLNPQRDFELSRKRWSRAYQIVETRHRG